MCPRLFARTSINRIQVILLNRQIVTFAADDRTCRVPSAAVDRVGCRINSAGGIRSMQLLARIAMTATPPVHGIKSGFDARSSIHLSVYIRRGTKAFFCRQTSYRPQKNVLTAHLKVNLIWVNYTKTLNEIETRCDVDALYCGDWKYFVVFVDISLQQVWKMILFEIIILQTSCLYCKTSGSDLNALLL